MQTEQTILNTWQVTVRQCGKVIEQVSLDYPATWTSLQVLSPFELKYQPQTWGTSKAGSYKGFDFQARLTYSYTASDIERFKEYERYAQQLLRK